MKKRKQHKALSVFFSNNKNKAFFFFNKDDNYTHIWIFDAFFWYGCAICLKVLLQKRLEIIMFKWVSIRIIALFLLFPLSISHRILILGEHFNNIIFLLERLNHIIGKKNKLLKCFLTSKHEDLSMI